MGLFFHAIDGEGFYEQHPNPSFEKLGKYFYIMRPEVLEWLKSLPDVPVPFSFGLLKRRAAVFIHTTNDFTPYFVASAGKLKVLPRPPKIYFARKSDRLLFKLTMGGKS